MRFTGSGLIIVSGKAIGKAVGKTVVKAASLYHTNVPVLQVPDNVILSPAQMLEGLADAPVGAFGTAVTVTVTLDAALLHVPLTHEP